jgi:hypothetical protein
MRAGALYWSQISKNSFELEMNNVVLLTMELNYIQKTLGKL